MHLHSPASDTAIRQLHQDGAAEVVRKTVSAMSRVIRDYRFVAAIVTIALSPILKAQPTGSLQSSYANTIFFDLGGTGLFSSVNYGRVLGRHDGYFISGIAGIGMFPPLGGTGATLTIPQQFTLSLGRGIHFLEAGLGGTYATGKTNASGYAESWYTYNLSPIVGYRVQFRKRMVFRAYLSPIVHLFGEIFIEDYKVLPYFGLSLGHQF